MLRAVEGGTAHLHLTIENGSEPIAGSLAGPDGKPHRFDGWIELVVAIENARHRLIAPMPGGRPSAPSKTRVEP